MIGRKKCRVIVGAFWGSLERVSVLLSCFLMNLSLNSLYGSFKVYLSSRGVGCSIGCKMIRGICRGVVDNKQSLSWLRSIMLTGLITEVKSGRAWILWVSASVSAASVGCEGANVSAASARECYYAQISISIIFSARVRQTAYLFLLVSVTWKNTRGSMLLLEHFFFFFFLSVPFCSPSLFLTFDIPLFPFFPNQRHLHTTVPLFHSSHLLISPSPWRRRPTTKTSTWSSSTMDFGGMSVMSASLPNSSNSVLETASLSYVLTLTTVSLSSIDVFDSIDALIHSRSN